MVLAADGVPRPARRVRFRTTCTWIAYRQGIVMWMTPSREATIRTYLIERVYGKVMPRHYGARGTFRCLLTNSSSCSLSYLIKGLGLCGSTVPWVLRQQEHIPEAGVLTGHRPLPIGQAGQKLFAVFLPRLANTDSLSRCTYPRRSLGTTHCGSGLFGLRDY